MICSSGLVPSFFPADNPKILLIIYGGVIEAAVTKGLGRHIEHITINMPDNAVPIALLSQVSQPLVIMSCALGKTSFIMTLFRIGSNTGIRFFLWFILASVNCLHILVSVLLFLRCENPRVLWDPSVQTTCWPVHNYLRIMYFIGGKGTLPVKTNSANPSKHILRRLTSSWHLYRGQ